ncbi:MAG: undecaprenyl-diphosphatase UppP [Bryobacteraceae bacterium]
MSLLQVIILAVVQGFTEFLPISSSAHLALAPWLLGWEDQGLTFDIALHLGTLAAVLVYFYRDWLHVTAMGFGLRLGGESEVKRNPKLLWLLAAASVPVAVFGLLFKDHAETTLRSPFVIGTMLILVGVIMGIGDHIGTRKKGIGDITWMDGLLIGAAQAIAIIPGTSRSGITITAALFRNIDRAAAARFSFLLSTPAIAGAAAKASYDLYKQGGVPESLVGPFCLGILLSAITGWAVIALFLRFLRRNNLRFFVFYRIVFGIIIFALALFRQQAG